MSSEARHLGEHPKDDIHGMTSNLMCVNVQIANGIIIAHNFENVLLY